MSRLLVPDHFAVPEGITTPDFKIRPLLITDVDKDYEAVASSLPDIKHIFGLASNWAEKGITRDQNLIDLGWHHKEFQQRTSFAYTVMAPDESQCLGCTYIHPSGRVGYEVEVYYWVRSSHKHLEASLSDVFRGWMKNAWPFKSVAYPGRDIAWEKWNSLRPM